jgi:type I restriction enzyme S subunit
VGIPWVKIANVGVGELVWSETSYLPFEYASDYKDFLLYESDVIIAMTRPLLGNRLKVAVVGSNDTPSLLNQRVGRFLFVGISKWFTFHLIKFQAFIEQLQLSLLGSDPPNISSRQVENIIIPLPPLEEQEKIASILTEVDNKIDSLKKRKSAYTTLKTGLMQQLLTGQKRVKA